MTESGYSIIEVPNHWAMEQYQTTTMTLLARGEIRSKLTAEHHFINNYKVINGVVYLVLRESKSVSVFFLIRLILLITNVWAHILCTE